MTAVSQFCLHLLIVTLCDGIETQGYNSDNEEEGREETRNQADACDRRFRLQAAKARHIAKQ